MALRGRVRNHRRAVTALDETKSKNWCTTASTIGSHHTELRFQRSSLSLVLPARQPADLDRGEQLSSREIGMHAELPRARFERCKSAMPVFRPSNDYVRYHKTRAETPVPMWLQGARSSDIYGGEVPKKNLVGAAANHYEAQFARTDAFNGRKTNLVTEETHAAVRWQQQAVAEAERLHLAATSGWKTGHSGFNGPDATSLDGAVARPTKEKDIPSVLSPGSMVPTIDPRKLAGERRLPSRSFCIPGVGPGRSIDF